MKQGVFCAICILLGACATHKQPEPTLPLEHSAQWEEQVQMLSLPHSLPPDDTLQEETFPPDQINNGETAKELLSQQAGAKIDTYFYYMNRWYREQQAVFILSTRTFYANRQPDGTYLMTCTAKARTGVDNAHTHTLRFPCGVWKVDVGLQIVLPHDKKAEDIWAE